MLKIDKEKCVNCGICSDVCLYGSIQMTEDGPVAKNDTCMKCGHCVAYCPTGSLFNSYMPNEPMKAYEDSLECTNAQAGQLLTSLRSVRNYQNKPVEHEKIEEILNVTRMAFSGGNSQGISYIAIDNPEKLEKIKELIIPNYVAGAKANPLSKGLKALAEHSTIDGIDTILWGAPCIVLAKSDKLPAEVARINSLISLTYARLYAQTLGIGSCWAGAVEGGFLSKKPELRELLQLGDDFDKVSSAVVFGYPKYKQHRIPSRNELQLEWMH